MRDYHTAQEVRRADTSKRPQETVLSERFYLADADFLVGLQGEEPFLRQLASALQTPVWQICLGRKAFVPSLPVCERVVNGDVIDVLKSYPWRKRLKHDQLPDKPLRMVMEVDYGTGEPRQDVPLSFVSRDRRFAVRHVVTQFLDEKTKPPVLEPDAEVPLCS